MQQQQKIYIYNPSLYFLQFSLEIRMTVSERKKKKKQHIADIWTFQKLNPLQRREPVKTFHYEYETIEITAASTS